MEAHLLQWVEEVAHLLPLGEEVEEVPLVVEEEEELAVGTYLMGDEEQL